MKKWVSVFLVFAVMISVLAGCGNDQAKSSGNENKVETENTSEEEGLVNNTYQTGYPIVKDKITLNAVVAAGPNDGQLSEMDYFKELEELTNIHLEFEQYSQNSAERINLMFASRDFPDILFIGGTDKQVLDAAAAGDIIPLNDLIEEYAPNWKRILSEEMPYAKKVITMPDGNIYRLPYINDGEVEKGMRDQWLINVKWLDELGLDVPTTTEEYRQVLKAFKDNAGKGSIPEDVIPWYFRYNQYVGGQFDLYGAFGLLIPSPEYIMVENGQVKFQATNPDIKEPIRYLHELYVDGLIPPEAFTDDSNTYLAKTRSNPAICGAMHSFHNPDLTETVYNAMEPIKAPGVENPLYRQQVSRVLRDRFAIFANNKYPEASIRIADILAEEEWTVRGQFGVEGMHFEKTSDGKTRLLPEDKVESKTQYAPAATIPLALTKEVTGKLLYDEGTALAYRAKAYEMYKPYIAPLESFYPLVVFTEEQEDKKAMLSTDIQGYVDETIARWIVNGGIEEEWDTYVEKIQEMGLDEMIQVYQEALDTFNQ